MPSRTKSKSTEASICECRQPIVTVALSSRHQGPPWHFDLASQLAAKRTFLQSAETACSRHFSVISLICRCVLHRGNLLWMACHFEASSCVYLRPFDLPQLPHGAQGEVQPLPASQKRRSTDDCEETFSYEVCDLEQNSLCQRQ